MLLLSHMDMARVYNKELDNTHTHSIWRVKRIKHMLLSKNAFHLGSQRFMYEVITLIFGPVKNPNFKTILGQIYVSKVLMMGQSRLGLTKSSLLKNQNSIFTSVRLI